MENNIKELTEFIVQLEQYAKSKSADSLEKLLLALADFELFIINEEIEEEEKNKIIADIHLLQDSLNRQTEEQFLALLILSILVSVFNYLEILSYSFQKINVSINDPDKSYWDNRVDGVFSKDGLPYHEYNKGLNYLTLYIPESESYEINGKIPYINSEVYNSPYTSIQPKNVIVNTFPVDKISNLSQYLYDIFLNLPYLTSDNITFTSNIKVENLTGGSRGWGFWNTSVLPTHINAAWFIQLEGKDNFLPNGFYVQTSNGLNESMVRISDLDEGWHTYNIVMSANCVEYIVDGVVVHKESNCRIIPTAPMAFHNWVDNAVFKVGITFGHETQKTTKPRSNVIQSMTIDIGLNSNSVQAFYTHQKLLPQSQSPSQLSNWLSENHSGYNLSSWCFYGNLIDAKGEISAVSTILQYQDYPNTDTPLLNYLGFKPYISACTYCGSNTDGYLISGSLSLDNKNINFTKPWSITVNNNQALTCLSLTSGVMGGKGATYMMTANVLDVNNNALKVEIELEDKKGAIKVGYGPSSFLPQWLTNAQQLDIKANYQSSLKNYLEKSGDSMRGQGSYYYSMPLLEVKSYSVSGENNKIYSKGNQGTIWVDYVVQSFTTDSMEFVKTAKWKFFAIQFPSIKAALMVSVVEIDLGDSISSVLGVAKLYTEMDSISENGSYNSSFEWDLDDIKISVLSKADGFPKSCLVRLKSKDSYEVDIKLTSIRDNQIINFANTKKLEGVFNVEGSIKISGIVVEDNINGIAWGEVN